MIDVFSPRTGMVRAYFGASLPIGLPFMPTLEQVFGPLDEPIRQAQEDAKDGRGCALYADRVWSLEALKYARDATIVVDQRRAET